MRSARGVSPRHSMFDMAFLYLEAAISIIKCLGKPPLAERMTEPFVFAELVARARFVCGVFAG